MEIKTELKYSTLYKHKPALDNKIQHLGIKSAVTEQPCDRQVCTAGLAMELRLKIRKPECHRLLETAPPPPPSFFFARQVDILFQKQLLRHAVFDSSTWCLFIVAHLRRSCSWERIEFSNICKKAKHQLFEEAPFMPTATLYHFRLHSLPLKVGHVQYTQ